MNHRLTYTDVRNHLKVVYHKLVVTFLQMSSHYFSEWQTAKVWRECVILENNFPLTYTTFTLLGSCYSIFFHVFLLFLLCSYFVPALFSAQQSWREALLYVLILSSAKFLVLVPDEWWGLCLCKFCKQMFADIYPMTPTPEELLSMSDNNEISQTLVFLRPCNMTFVTWLVEITATDRCRRCLLCFAGPSIHPDLLHSCLKV